MLKTRKRWISLLVTLAMLVAFVVPFAGPASAGAASYTTVTSIPKFDSSDSTASAVYTATVQIKLDPAIAQPSSAKIEVLDPDGGQLDIKGIVYSGASYVNTFSIGPLSSSTIQNGVNVFGSVYSTLDLSMTPTGTDAAKLNIGFIVDASDCSGGDIKVNIYNAQGQLEDGSVVVARASSAGVTAAVVGSPPTIGEDVSKSVTFRITENAANALKTGIGSIKIKLPAGFEWTATSPSTAAASVYATIDSSDSRILLINRTGSAASASTFDISATVAVEDKDTAKKGDVVATVEGQNDTTVTPSELTVATYADYGADITVDSVKTLIAGKTEQKTDKIRINEKIAGSFIEGRRITVEFPEWVKLDTIPLTDMSSDFTLGGTNYSINTDRNKLYLTVPTKSDKTKFEFKAQFSIEGNHSGDLVATISGAGIDATDLTIAKVVTPVTVTAANGSVKIGVQDQAAPDITIVESQAGAIEKTGNNKLQIVLPDGAEWADTPTVAVIDGDLSIEDKNITADGATLTIPVKSESVKASTIKISGIKLTLDRTVPEGGLTAKVKGDTVVENYGSDSNEFNTDYAVKFAAANCVTPAPGEQKGTAVFKIGDAKYTLNGKEVTMDAAPYIKDGRTMVPVRFAANAVGVSDSNIIWDAAAKKVTVIKGDRVVQMTIGSNVMLINGAAITMDTAPEISSDRTMLPVRFLGQALGAEFVWDAAAQTVTVNF